MGKRVDKMSVVNINCDRYCQGNLQGDMLCDKKTMDFVTAGEPYLLH